MYCITAKLQIPLEKKKKCILGQCTEASHRTEQKVPEGMIVTTWNKLFPSVTKFVQTKSTKCNRDTKLYSHHKKNTPEDCNRGQ